MDVEVCVGVFVMDRVGVIVTVSVSEDVGLPVAVTVDVNESVGEGSASCNTPARLAEEWAKTLLLPLCAKDGVADAFSSSASPCFTSELSCTTRRCTFALAGARKGNVMRLRGALLQVYAVADMRAGPECCVGPVLRKGQQGMLDVVAAQVADMAGTCAVNGTVALGERLCATGNSKPSATFASEIGAGAGRYVVKGEKEAGGNPRAEHTAEVFCTREELSRWAPDPPTDLQGTRQGVAQSAARREPGSW